MKWFKVATAGITADGREIKAQWLTDIAETYDKAKYTARVWLEHMRGMSPSSEFNAVGTVEAVKVEEVDGKTTLFAQITPSESLKTLNQDDKKISPSIEVNIDFAGSGKAYLDGLGVTDSPASLYTDVLKFSAASNFTQPLRGSGNQVFHQTADWSDIDFATVFDVGDATQTTQTAEANKTNLFAKIKQVVADAFAKNRDKTIDSGVLTEFASTLSEAVADEFAAFSKKIEDKFSADLDAANQRITQLEQDLADATNAAQKTAGDFATPRQTATGGSPSDKQKADC